MIEIYYYNAQLFVFSELIYKMVHLAESRYVLQFARTKVPAGFDSKISNFAIPQ